MSIFKELNIQTHNLKTLAYYLLSLPKDYKHFDMNDFRRDSLGEPLRITREVPLVEGCGTAGCAIGHAPMLKHVTQPTVNESWSRYSDRFTFNTDSGDTSFEQDYVWQWFFGGFWACYDNTPQGAGKRIMFALHSEENMNEVINLMRRRDDLCFVGAVAKGWLEDYIVPENTVYKIDILGGE